MMQNDDEKKGVDDFHARAGVYSSKSMTEQPWNTGKPPNETLVEVEHEGRVIVVQAIWGRDGEHPHWESEDRNMVWSPTAFSRWRYR